MKKLGKFLIFTLILAIPYAAFVTAVIQFYPEFYREYHETLILIFPMFIVVVWSKYLGKR